MISGSSHNGSNISYNRKNIKGIKEETSEFFDLINTASKKYEHFGLGEMPRDRYDGFTDLDIDERTTRTIHYVWLSDHEIDYMYSKLRYLKLIDVSYFFGAAGFGLDAFKKLNLNKRLLVESHE